MLTIIGILFSFPIGVLLDLLGISRSILAQPQFNSNQHEVLVFITLFYRVTSYIMSIISQRLELALSVGQL